MVWRHVIKKEIVTDIKYETPPSSWWLAWPSGTSRCAGSQLNTHHQPPLPIQITAALCCLIYIYIYKKKKSDPVVPLIHYAEGKLLLGEIILQILQIHNKASQRTHASAAACQSDCLSFCPSFCDTAQNSLAISASRCSQPEWDREYRWACGWLIY